MTLMKQMPTRVKRLTNSLLLTVLLLSLVAGIAYGFLYRAPVTITENASTSYDMLPVAWNQNNTWLAANGFMAADALDTRVQTLGGSNKPWMVADNKTLTAVPVPADSQTNLFFTTGESAASAMDIIFGYGGYVSTNDTAALEPGAAFSVNTTDIYLRPAQSDNLTLKSGAVRLYTNSDGLVYGSLTGAATWESPAVGLLSQSGLGTYNAAQTVDGDIGTNAFETNASGVGSYLRLDYGAGNTKDLVGWRYYAGNINLVTTWNIQYSDNAADWTTVYTGLDMNGSVGYHTATWSSAGGHRYWQSYLAAGNSPNFHTELGVSPNPEAIISVAGASEGEADVTLALSGGTATLTVDGSSNTTAFAGSVADTANNWIWMRSNPYAGVLSLTVGGTEVVRYSPIAIVNGVILPDRAGTAHNGDITWGSNPAGVGATLGSFTSAGQPSVGTTSDTSTRNILPVVGGTDWRPAAGVSATLQANPMRPIVTAISDNTTLSEYQVWVWFGIIFVVFILILVGSRVRGHHLITGIAVTAALILMVVWTVFPWGVLFIAALAIVFGLVSERSPSL